MNNSYTLVNPTILGTFPKDFSGETPIDGAKKFWLELTNNNYLINTFPKFHFTMKGGSNELHHFQVTEKLSGNKKTTKT